MYVHVVKVTILALTLSSTLAINIQDCPQWRGQARDGRVIASPSADWRAAPTLTWKIDIGEGHSSPVSQGNRIFVLSRRSENEIVSCLDRESGKIIWQQTYGAPYTMNSAAYAHGKGPKSTPVIHQGHLYTLGISGVLSCFDLHEGKLQWQHRFLTSFEHTSPLYGASMSPLAIEDQVIAHVGGEDDGALRAFDCRTGKVNWSWEGDGPGYASPILVKLEGVRQVVTQTQDSIVGVALSDGRLLWQIPFSTAWQQNVVTPVLYKDLLILSGLDKGTFAIRLERNQSGWSAREVWSTRDVSMYMSSPVLADNLLFGLSHLKRGQLFCLNPANGEVLWKGDGRQGDYAGLLSSGKLLFVLTTDGEFLVIETSAEALKKLAQHTVADSPTWAHPVILGSQLLIKDFSSLALWSF
jgi:outer membrane protein assembly factor BamB